MTKTRTKDAPPSPANGPLSLDLREQVAKLQERVEAAEKANASLVELVRVLCAGMDNLRIKALGALG